jgi:starch-binding outer membrane protein, SusD/RagB family
MKKNLIYLLYACLFVSCNSLDVETSSQYSSDVVWKSITNLDAYVRGLYAQSLTLYSEFKTSGSALSDGYTDLLQYTLTGADSNCHNYIESGSIKITPSTLGTYLSPWSSTYVYIKNCNEYLVNVKKYGGDLDASQLKIRTAEVRFLRAFLYHKLAVRHGGVVMRTSEDALDGPTENNKARATTAETWNFVISELDKAAQDLPSTWDSSNKGRITKGAAFGLAARSALYAGLYDKAIAEVDSVEVLANQGIYGFVALADLFTAPVANNKELMIYKQFVTTTYVNDLVSEIAPSGDYSGYGANICPTNELADLYDIKVNGSWQSFSWSNLSSYTSGPYVNRDPRFYTTIMYNGESWKARTIQTYVGGTDQWQQYTTALTTRTTTTGYYIRKFAENSSSKLISDGNVSNWIEMRYTEMKFIKSEAYARKGDFINAYAFLNAVRTRSQVAIDALPVQTTWALYLNDLQKEKAREFACEGQRYWDLRRWGLGPTILTQRCHGVKITNSSGTLTYTTVYCDGYTRYYDSKYDVFPIPVAETNNNTLCVQDDNWK